MIQALVVGAVTGLALFLLVYALIPRRVGLARRIAAFDEGRAPALKPVRYPGDGNESAFSKRLGAALARFCAEQGWEFRSLRSNLNLVGKSFENFLATKVLLGLFGLIFPPVVLAGIGLAGVHLSVIVPVWAGRSSPPSSSSCPTSSSGSRWRSGSGTSGTPSAPSWTWLR